MLADVVALRDRALSGPPQSAVRLLPEANLHLTLRFLGDTDEGLIAPLAESLRRVVSEAAPIPIRLSGGGCFPHARNPRVLWAGIEAPQGGLAELYARISEVLAGLGFPADDKPFHPHVTVGYLRKGVAASQARRAAEALQRYAGAPVGAQGSLDILALKQSRLEPAGAVHTALHSFRLGE